MNTNKQTSKSLEDVKVNVKIKLSALWIALMFLFVYVDFFGFFKPGTIEGILAGKVWVLEITQIWALTALILMTIPSVMIFLCLSLKPKVNRWTNIIVGIFFLVVTIANPLGETWVFMWFGALAEGVLLLLIVWYAWTWPKQEA